MRKTFPISYSTKRRKLDLTCVCYPHLDEVPKNQLKVAIDTETELITRHEYPKIVIAQFYYPEAKLVHIVHYTKVFDYLDLMLKQNPEITLIFFNAAFDLNSLKWRTNKLQEIIFKKPSRIKDLMIRYLLNLIELGKNTNTQSNLAFVANKFLGVDLKEAKEDVTIRLNFRRNQELTEQQVEYAWVDAVVTGELDNEIAGVSGETLQVLASLAFYDLSVRGIPVDVEYFNQLRNKYERLMEEAKQKLFYFGYIPGQSGNRKALIKIVFGIEKQLNRITSFKFPRTPSNPDVPALNENALASLPPIVKEHPFFKWHSNYVSYNGILTKYLDPEFLGPDGKFHPRISLLKVTGRPSMSYPPVQQFPRKGGIRECISAGKNKILFIADIKQAELVSLAQHCLTHFGFSNLAKTINSGEDIHILLSKKYCEVTKMDYTRLPDDRKAYLRQFSKIGNFGFAGGLGWGSFVNHCRKFGLDITQEEAKLLREAWLRLFPEMVHHLNPLIDEISTAREIRNWLIEHGVIEIFDNLKIPFTLNAFRTFLIKYFKFNDEKISRVLAKVKRYKVKTITGRQRFNMIYTKACNYQFQEPTAAAAKLAVVNLWRLGYRLVHFIYDEVVIELPIDSHLQDRVKECCNVIKKSFMKVTPNVIVEVEAALSKQWTKDAETVLDDNGDYLVWTPTGAKHPYELIEDSLITGGPTDNVDTKQSSAAQAS